MGCSKGSDVEGTMVTSVPAKTDQVPVALNFALSPYSRYSRGCIYGLLPAESCGLRDRGYVLRHRQKHGTILRSIT